MRIGRFTIDEWKFELNQMGNPSWYKTCHGYIYIQEGLSAKAADITIYNNLPHHPWHLGFQRNIFKKEYFIMYRDKTLILFQSADAGKSAIDVFLNKLSKLKAFV